MSVLLDTHILLWWFLDSPELPRKYAESLARAEREGHGVSVSIISFWEIAKLASSGRVRFSVSLDQWLEDLEQDPLLRVLPLTSAVILESTRLGEGFHKDPADQLIVATARCHALRLMTVDERIRRAGAVMIA